MSSAGQATTLNTRSWVQVGAWAVAALLRVPAVSGDHAASSKAFLYAFWGNKAREEGKRSLQAHAWGHLPKKTKAGAALQPGGAWCKGQLCLLKWPCDCVRLQVSGRRERRQGFRWITLSLIPASVFPRRRAGGCPPHGALFAAGSWPSWGRDGVVAMKWNSVEVSICWLQRAFLVVRGSGGRKERQDKNKAAVLYLAINHFGFFIFFSSSIWRLCNKQACSWIFYFIPLLLGRTVCVAVAFLQLRIPMFGWRGGLQIFCTDVRKSGCTAVALFFMKHWFAIHLKVSV